MRVSEAIRVKSVSTDSSCSPSSTRVPVGPPTKPAAITGRPSRLSARATLTPLPPATVRLSTARWRRPRRKFGTATVRSMAAFRVTVRITSTSPLSHSWVFSVGAPTRQEQHRDHEYHERHDRDRDRVVSDGGAGAVEEAGLGDRAAGPQRHRSHPAAPDEDRRAPQPGAALDRALDLPRRPHPQVDPLAAAHPDLERALGTQRQPAPGVADLRLGEVLAAADRQ